MPKVGRYCKAYPVERLRRFAGWSDELYLHKPTSEASEEGRRLQDADVLFIQEDLTVTEGIFLDENVVFNNVTPEWKQFCESELGFQVPSHITTASASRDQ